MFQKFTFVFLMVIYNNINVLNQIPITKCDLSTIERHCKLGATYCTFEENEYCTECLDTRRILASSYKDKYSCVLLDYTLCAHMIKCKICNENGHCLLCDEEGYISYDGVCIKMSEKYKCNIDNCISCSDSGQTCHRCKLGYAIKDDKCVENNRFCAKFDTNNNQYCTLCHLGYIMNYNYNGCRKYDRFN